MTARTLERSPRLTALYAKAAAGSLPLPGRTTHGASSDLVAGQQVRLDDLAIDAGHVERYRDVCSFSRSAHLPVTYPHVLAFPLHLALMTGSAFPFPAIGAVHISNTIRQLRKVSPDERLAIEVRVADLRPHPRGRQVTLATTCSVDGSVVWESDTVVLHREQSDTTGEAAQPDVPDQAPLGPQTWRLPSGLGRRYAAVSGDRNPIHLFDLTAMPLGFRHHIAHGMWSKARCVAEIENRLPAAYSVTVAFKKPIRLPGKVTFGARQDGDAIDFGLQSGSGSAHLLGRVASL